jgi:hypothetical protein
MIWSLPCTLTPNAKWRRGRWIGVGMTILPAGSDIRRVWVRARNLTRGSYPYLTRFYYGSGTDLISYPRVPDGYPKIVILDFQPTSTLASCPPSTAHPTAIPPCLLMLLI